MFGRDNLNSPSREKVIRFEATHGELVLIDNLYYLAEDLARLDVRSSLWFPPPAHNRNMMFHMRKKYLETRIQNAEAALVGYKEKLRVMAERAFITPTLKQKRIVRSLREELQAAKAKLQEFMKPYQQHQAEMLKADHEAKLLAADARAEVNKL